MDAIRNCDVLAMQWGLSFAFLGGSRVREGQLSSTVAFCNNEKLRRRHRNRVERVRRAKTQMLFIFLRNAAVNLNDPHC